MKFPDRLIRGISNISDVDVDECVVMSGAFSFKDVAREDSYKELSINWLDNHGAIREANNKKKDNGEIQFKAGIALLNRKKIDYILRDHIEQKRFNYERKPIEGNEYHGNLLIKSTVKKQIERIIVAGICLCVDKILEPLD